MLIWFSPEIAENRQNSRFGLKQASAQDQLSRPETFQTEQFKLGGAALFPQQAISEQASGAGSMHKAVSREAAAAIEASNLRWSEDRVLIWRHLIEARPGASNGRACQCGAPAPHLTLQEWPEGGIQVQIERLWFQSTIALNLLGAHRQGHRQGHAAVSAAEVKASFGIHHHWHILRQIVKDLGLVELAFERPDGQIGNAGQPSHQRGIDSAGVDHDWRSDRLVRRADALHAVLAD